MNAVQYYIIDSFIKDPAGGVDEGGEEEQMEEEHEGLMVGRRDSEDDREERGEIGDERLKEANPTPLSVEYDSDDDKRVGSSSSRGSTTKDLQT